MEYLYQAVMLLLLKEKELSISLNMASSTEEFYVPLVHTEQCSNTSSRSKAISNLVGGRNQSGREKKKKSDTAILANKVKIALI